MAEDQQQEYQSASPTAQELSRRHSGVLSDEDIEAEITSRKLVYAEDESDCIDGIKGDCYDFRIGRLLIS